MLGARMHFAVPALLADAGLLHTFYTDTYVGNKPWLSKILDRVPGDLRPESFDRLSGRSSPGIPGERVVSFGLFGLSYFLNRRRPMTPSAFAKLASRTNRQFGSRVIQAGLDGAKVVWGFNGAALEIFQHARARGIFCVLEQTIAPRKLELELLKDESARWPEWQRQSYEEGADSLAEREAAEWALADRIVCGSHFVAEALVDEGVRRDQINVVPYGVDLTHFKSVSPRNGEALNLLFMGEVGLRKGVPYLLNALRELDRPEQIRAKLAGPIALERSRISKYKQWCEFVGAVTRAKARELYSWADVFVLPSICEGSATVTYEAMACGLPIITTRASGSLVRDGIDGFIVDAGDVEKLRLRIALLCDDLHLRSQMSAAAVERREEISLAAYGKRLLNVLSRERNESVRPIASFSAASI
jgi:glycosyltransferase involved in cell wall biosynthesis